MDSLEEFIARQSQGGVENAVAALRDPNSSVWKPNAYGDPRTSAAAMAFSLGNNHGLDPNQSAQAMQMAGYDGSAVQQASQAIVGQQQASSAHWNTGLGDQFKEFITPPAIMALAALTANTLGPSLAGAGSASGGATAAGAGAAAGAAEGAGGAVATGVGGAGAPIVSGLAEGASPFISTEAAGGLAGLGESFVGPATGTVESAPVIGGAGVPTVSGVASGAGPFIPTIGGTTGLSSLISKGLSGGNGVSPSDAGWLSLLSRAVPGLVGAYASNKQADALGDLSKQWMDLGAPSRARYEGSFAPGFTMASDPGYSDALNASANATLRGLSATNGNPAGNPNAWAKTLEDVNAKVAYPALQDYRRTNAGTGGLAALTSAAPAAATAAIGAQGNVYNALGGAAADVLNPPMTLADLMKMFGNGSAGGNGMKFSLA